jgi:hypothetical protein
MILFVSESHLGSHINVPERYKGTVNFVSLQGNRGIYFDGKNFTLSKGLQNLLSSANKVIIATDLDVEGTKSATVIKNFCDAKGIKSFRVALTEKGYVRVGQVFTKKQMKKLSDLAKKNKYFYERYGFGFQTTLILGRAYRDNKEGVKKIKVLNKNGTSTITVMTKFGLKGISPITGYKTLNQLYRRGIIEYPRVDNDYIQDKPFTLYPHPPLYPKSNPENRKKNFFLSPLNDDEIDLNRRTYLLRLSNLRLITPATAPRYYRKLEEFFEEDMSPKKKRRKILEKLAKLAEKREKQLREFWEDIFYPQRELSEPIPIRELLPEIGNIEVNYPAL